MQVKDLIVTGDARVLGKIYTSDGAVSGGASGGGSSGDGSGLTYTLSKSGSTITLTGSDGSTSSVTDANTDTNTTYSNATTSAAGLMSASDKSKLDGIASGATKITVDSSLSSSSTNPVQNKVVNSALAGKAASSHTHDDRYYTETEVNNLLNGKANSSHSHSASDISSLASTIQSLIDNGVITMSVLMSPVKVTMGYITTTAVTGTGKGRLFITLNSGKKATIVIDGKTLCSDIEVFRDTEGGYIDFTSSYSITCSAASGGSYTAVYY